MLRGHQAMKGLQARRVSSLTDLVDHGETRKSIIKACKSEECISSSEFVISRDILQSGTTETAANVSRSQHSGKCSKNGKIQRPVLPSNNGAELELLVGDKCMKEEQVQKATEDQSVKSFSERKVSNALGSRSLSACVCFKSSILTNEQLRKNKSYTAFPHISKEQEPLEDSVSPFIHRTSCFRLMPHFSESSFPDPNFSTISVMSVSAQYENSPQVLIVEASGEDSDEKVNTFDETVLHSWRRSTSRQRSFSDPVSKEALGRRSLSLPDIDKETSGLTETFHKVTASPSRLQFPEQPLERLKEEMSPFAQSAHSLQGDSSSIMSVVNTDDGHIGYESFYFQTGDEEVTDCWINSKRRRSISKQTSLSLLRDIEEGNTEVDSDLRKTAASIVKQVTVRVLSSHDVDVSSDDDNGDQSHTVEAAVKLWKAKASGRRATLASGSPLADCSKYASEIEQQAFQKIRKWKDSFASKLNNVLGERFQEMVSKREEEIHRNKKPKVLKVPMNLSDKEMGQLRNNLVMELKRKSIGGGVFDEQPINIPPASLPIPRIKYPKTSPSEQNPKDLKAQMMKELTRRVSCVVNEDESLHCCTPSSLIPEISKTSLSFSPQRPIYLPREVTTRTLDPNSIRDLLSWHEAERKRLKAELENLPQAEMVEGQQLLIDKDDVNKVLQSMMKIMEDIFTGTMKRFMGNVEMTPSAEQEEKQVQDSDRLLKESEEDGEKLYSQISHEERHDSQIKLSTLGPDGRDKLYSKNDSVQSLSSDRSAEPQSSELSLVAISCTSSNEECSVFENIDKVHSEPVHHTQIKAGSCTLLAMSQSLEGNVKSESEDTVSIPSASHEADGTYYKQHSTVAFAESTISFKETVKHSDSETSTTAREALNCTMQTGKAALHPKLDLEWSDVNGDRAQAMTNTDYSAVCCNHEHTEIQKPLGVLQEQKETGNLFTREILNPEELNAIETKLQSSFNNLTGEKNEREKLLFFAKHIYFSNNELLQQIERKCKIISQKDNEIQGILKSKNEAETLLKEVKKELVMAYKETKRLQSVIKQYEEERINPMQSCTKCQEAVKTRKSYTISNCDPVQNGKESNNIEAADLCRTEEGKLLINKGADDKQNARVNLEVFKTSDVPNACEYQKTVEISNTRNSAARKHWKIKEIGIPVWLSDIIRHAKGQLESEQPWSSPGSSTVPHSLLSRTFHREDINGIASVTTSRKRTQGIVEGKHLPSARWFHKSEQAVPSEGSLAFKIDTSVAFPDVFLTRFEYVDLSRPEKRIPIQSFKDMFFPWVCSRDDDHKQLWRNGDPRIKNDKTLAQVKRPAALPRVKQFLCDKDIATVGGLVEKNGQKPPKQFEKKGSHIPLVDLTESKGLCGSIMHGTACSDKNEVQPFQNEISLDRRTAEYFTEGLEHSLTSSNAPSVENCFHFELKDSKMYSTRKDAALSSDHSIVDSISLKISLNTNQLLHCLENKGIIKRQKSQGKDQKINKRCSKEGQLTWQRLESQAKPSKYLSVSTEMIGFKQNALNYCFPRYKPDFTSVFNRNSSSKLRNQLEEETKIYTGKHLKDFPANKASHTTCHILPVGMSCVKTRTEANDTTSLNSSQISSIEKENRGGSNMEGDRLPKSCQIIFKGQGEMSKIGVTPLRKGDRNTTKSIATNGRGTNFVHDKQLGVDAVRDSNDIKKVTPMCASLDMKERVKIKTRQTNMKAENKPCPNKIIYPDKKPNSGNMGRYQERSDSRSINERSHVENLTKICQSIQDVLEKQEDQDRAIKNYKQKINLMNQELQTVQTNTDIRRKKEGKMPFDEIVSSVL